MSGTIAEKILARASDSDDVAPDDHVVCNVDTAMCHDLGAYEAIPRLEQWGVDEVWDPSRIVFVMDHVAPSGSVEDANAKTRIREFVDEQGIEHFYDVGAGISHEVLPEQGHVRPGELLVGRDSHTTSGGAFGAAATGVGGSDIAFIMATGQCWFRVPETIEFDVTGQFDDRVSPKDLMLYLAGEFGTDVARYKAIEFVGPAIESLPIDDRVTLSNMSIELGGKFGFTPVDDTVFEYVDDRTDEQYVPQRSDPGADYAETYQVDVGDLPPQVAKPHEVGNVGDIGDVEGVELDQVFIGSCTNGKLSDLAAAADILEGNEVDPDTRVIVTPASREVFIRAERDGIIDVFNDAGVVVTNATCGACPGLGMGVLGDGEVCLAAQNRNFKGRMGSDSSEVYLASPETAAASAVTGRITDPREV